MKTISKYILPSLMAGVMLTSCDSWLDTDDTTMMNTDKVYSSVSTISSVAANFYSRMNIYQDFNNGLMDIARWDECTQSSAYWDQAGNVGNTYRLGDYTGRYTLIRELNIHIQELANATGLSEEQRRYFIGEGRFLRALVYFELVNALGGVPIITEPFEYTENTIELARKRNTEVEVWEFIANEMDEIIQDLKVVGTDMKSRATAGAALALKCRSMLYAGSIAYRDNINQSKGLYLASGAAGIPAEKANEYFQKCLDSYFEISKLGYSLYKADSDLANNYSQLFQSSTGNPEAIFTREYDGTTFLNVFTQKCICAAMHAGLKTGCELSPTVNQADCYELTATHTSEPLNPYVGDVQIESMGDGPSSFDYKVYDNIGDIFDGRDPRLTASIILPGSTFRDAYVDFQAGLAIRGADGHYTFVTVDKLENYQSDANYYNGERITGLEGPHRTSQYYSHSGFLMRKCVDVRSGSEAEGASTVPKIIYRYGEVLLNAAEAAYCLAQNGISSYEGYDTKALSLDLINQIRERAGGENFRINASELTMERIMNERRVELAYEDHRYNDLKRWRIADEVWAYDETNETSIMKGLWPYKIYAPGHPDNGKWIYRRVRIEHRGTTTYYGQPLNFSRNMYYMYYPMNPGNPYIEQNPHQ